MSTSILHLARPDILELQPYQHAAWDRDQLAADRGLDADFHADETLDPSVNTLAQIAAAALETGFQGRIVAGHCCSLSTMPEGDALRTLDLVARAGIAIVSLPMCNLYLQDRVAHRTPRWRGITMVHEMKARGINVSFASDNTRDPFYAYGDMDMVEVLREAGYSEAEIAAYRDALAGAVTWGAAAVTLPGSRVPAPHDLDGYLLQRDRWARGNLAALSRPAVAIVGSRAGTPYGLAMPGFAGQGVNQRSGLGPAVPEFKGQ